MNRTLLFAAALLPASLAAHAANITYDVFDSFSNVAVSGTITTDGTIGTIATSDITGFNLTVAEAGSVLNLATGDRFGSIGGDLTASASSLSFDFDQKGALFFEQNGADGENFVCLQGPNTVCDYSSTAAHVGVNIAALNGDSDTGPFQQLSGILQIGTAVPASVTPEPSSMALLGTGLLGLALTARRRLA